MTSLVRLPLTREARFCVFGPIRKYQKEAWNRKSEENQTCLLPQENQHTPMTSLVRLPLTREARFCVFTTMKKHQKEALNRKREEKQTCLLPQENPHPTMSSLRWLPLTRFFFFFQFRLILRQKKDLLFCDFFGLFCLPIRSRCFYCFVKNTCTGKKVSFWPLNSHIFLDNPDGLNIT